MRIAYQDGSAEWQYDRRVSDKITRFANSAAGDDAQWVRAAIAGRWPDLLQYELLNDV